MATSQNGWPASPNAADIDVGTVSLPGTPLTTQLRLDVAPLLLAMARWWADNIEPLNPTGEQWCWGWEYRPISGSTTLSNHSSGTALDFCAPNHPRGVRGTVPDGMRAAISAQAASLGLRWGGDFTPPALVDEMHVEVVVDYATAMGLVAQLNASPGGGTSQQEDDMASVTFVDLPAGDKTEVVTAVAPVRESVVTGQNGNAWFRVNAGATGAVLHRVFALAGNNGDPATPTTTPLDVSEVTLNPYDAVEWQLPADVTVVVANYTSTTQMSGLVQYQNVP